MDITARDTSGPTGGFVALKIDDTTYSRFPIHVTFEVGDLPWRVEGIVYTDTSVEPDDMKPRVIQLTITERPGGKPIPAGVVSGVKLATIRDAAIRKVAQPMRLEGDKLVSVPGSEGTADPRTRQIALSQRGRNVTMDDLRAAVEAYRQAAAEGRTDRTAAVAERLYPLSKATAGRRIQKAREQGLLGKGE